MNRSTKMFQIPQSIKCQEDSLTESYGRIVVEPLERGFGATIGNSLRRVLISSIEGAAVVAVKIGGVVKELSSIKGVKEDVTDIILNLKRIRFRLHRDGLKTFSFKIKGHKVITGADIMAPSDVEVLNKDGYIATVDAGATLEMEIYVKKGRGYQPAETYKEKGLPLDVLYVDAVFSPIKKVNFLVEKTRVGRFTDYDKLIMDVWTDGSVSPQKAVSSASAILNDHFRLFIDETDEMAEHEEKAETAVVDPIDPSMNKNLLKNIEEIDITVRAYNCLKNANIKTVADLVQKTELDILRTKNFGQKSLDEIRDVLHSMGLDFGMAIEAADLNKYERESAQLGGRNASQGSRQAIK